MANFHRSGFDFAALAREVTTGPDAELLALITRYRHGLDRARLLCRAMDRVKQGGRRHRELWQEFAACAAEYTALESRIAALPARTPAGLCAKLEVTIDSIDPDGTGTSGRMLRLPLAALRDALAELAKQDRDER